VEAQCRQTGDFEGNRCGIGKGNQVALLHFLRTREEAVPPGSTDTASVVLKGVPSDLRGAAEFCRDAAEGGSASGMTALRDSSGDGLAGG
jgi:hypothetical protein